MENRLVTEVIYVDEAVVVTVVGEIDPSTSPLLREACHRAASMSSRLVLDLAGVTFMDSSALKVLIETRQRKDITTVVVRNASHPVRRLLEITGLTVHFQEPLPSPSQDQTATSTEATGHEETGGR